MRVAMTPAIAPPTTVTVHGWLTIRRHAGDRPDGAELSSAATIYYLPSVSNLVEDHSDVSGRRLQRTEGDTPRLPAISVAGIGRGGRPVAALPVAPRA